MDQKLHGSEEGGTVATLSSFFSSAEVQLEKFLSAVVSIVAFFVPTSPATSTPRVLRVRVGGHSLEMCTPSPHPVVLVVCVTLKSLHLSN